MSKSASREKRQQQTRQAILDAAQRIIFEQQLSMRSLAEWIDYSPSGLYEYFYSEEQIIQAVYGAGQPHQYEAIYSAMPKYGLGSVMEHVPAMSRFNAVRGRLNKETELAEQIAD